MAISEEYGGYTGYMENYHPNRIAALGIAAQDLITFGESYAGWIVYTYYI